MSKLGIVEDVLRKSLTHVNLRIQNGEHLDSGSFSDLVNTLCHIASHPELHKEDSVEAIEDTLNLTLGYLGERVQKSTNLQPSDFFHLLKSVTNVVNTLRHISPPKAEDRPINAE